MASYTDIGSVPGAWRDSSIAAAASHAINTTGSYTPSSGSSYVPSNASSVVDVYVSSRTEGAYNALSSASRTISSKLASGTATRAEVESYNASVRAFASRNPVRPK